LGPAPLGQHPPLIEDADTGRQISMIQRHVVIDQEDADVVNAR